MLSRLVIDIDRDSVAMGDDAESHAHRLSVRPGMRLSALLAAAAPGIGGRGWSWVAVADGRAVAVWSIDHGVQMLVDDARVTRRSGPAGVHFRYFLQIDPAWLHRRLAEGAPPNREALSREYRPLQEREWEREHRRRERELTERLVSPACLAAIVPFGADVELHNDRMMRFDLCGARWAVQQNDTMTRIGCGDSGIGGASIRPIALAERWLVAAVACSARRAAGLPGIPDFEPYPAPDLRPMDEWPPGTRRWSTVGEPTAQLSGEDAVACFRVAVGRSIDEIASLMAVRPAQQELGGPAGESGPAEGS